VSIGRALAGARSSSTLTGGGAMRFSSFPLQRLEDLAVLVAARSPALDRLS